MDQAGWLRKRPHDNTQDKEQKMIRRQYEETVDYIETAGKGPESLSEEERKYSTALAGRVESIVGKWCRTKLR